MSARHAAPRLAEGLCVYLEVAGVTRAELHTTDATRKAMTFHDLRATGLTWLASRGDDALRIKQRAGHSAFTTTEGEAEAVREGSARCSLRRLRRSSRALRPLIKDPKDPRSGQGDSTSRGETEAFRVVTLRGGRDSNPRPPA